VSVARLPTFELFLDDDRYAVPTFHLVVSEDVGGVLNTAQRLLEESDHHRGVEVCRGGERLDGLGSFATRRLPLDLRARSAAQD
jgi:hypothetical protein